VDLVWAQQNYGKTGSISKPPAKKKKPPKKGQRQQPAEQQAAPATPGGPTGTPPGVLRALSQFRGQAADLVNRARAADIARRNAFSTGLIGAGQTAADIYGGRSPAMLGQFISGQQRDTVRQAAANIQAREAQESALIRSLEQALGEQYSQYGQRALDEARRRGEMVSQIRAVGA
jgi:hypothetical protein